MHEVVRDTEINTPNAERCHRGCTVVTEAEVEEKETSEVRLQNVPTSLTGSTCTSRRVSATIILDLLVQGIDALNVSSSAVVSSSVVERLTGNRFTLDCHVELRCVFNIWS